MEKQVWSLLRARRSTLRPRVAVLPPHNAFQDTFLTMRDGPHRSCPRAQRVPVHPQVFPHSYLPLSRHSERMQQSQGDHLTGPEVGLGMFGDRAQLLIDLREQRRDKIDGGGQRLLRSSPGCTLATSVEEVPDHDKKASKYYDSYWFVRD